MDMSSNKRQATKNAPGNTSVTRKVLNAVKKLEGKKGVTLPNLKKFLRDERKMDLKVHNAEINMALKSGVDRGILVKESGNYKVQGTRGKSSGRRRSRSRGRTSSRKRSQPPKSGSARRRSRSSKRKRKAAGNGA